MQLDPLVSLGVLLTTGTFFAYLGWGLVTVVLTIIFGRFFCGWVCPQTIFVEMVFRKIEYLIEGNENKQRKLDEGSLTFEKFFMILFRFTLAYRKRGGKENWR